MDVLNDIVVLITAVIGVILLIKGLLFLIEVYRAIIYTERVVRKAMTCAKRITKNTEYVYMYSARKESPFLVKIGRTKNNPVQRLRAQKTANPHGIIVLAIIPVGNSVIAECVLHRLFHSQRVSPNNEWFRMNWRMFIVMSALQDKKLTDTVHRILMR